MFHQENKRKKGKENEKNLFGKILAAALALTLITGCGGGASSGGSAGTAGSSQGSGETQAKQEPSGEKEQAAASGISAEALKANFQVGINSDIGDISPFGNSSTGRTYAKYAIYENLLQFSAFGQNVEEMDRQIAKTVDVIDAVTADVEIYEYVHGYAGNSIIAEDIKF